jgi:hypothetical protein
MSTSSTQDGSERAPFTEGSTLRLTATLVDEDGAPVLAAAVTDVRATLATYPAGAVINARANQAVMNAAGGTVTDGTFAMRLNGADCAAQAGEAGLVQRELAVTVSYTLPAAAGTGTLNFVERYWVQLFDRLPQA